MFDVFLSHDWGAPVNILSTNTKKFVNHEKVKMVNEIFKDSLGFSTWLDEEKLGGNIRDEIIRGIEQSKCILVFLTRNYHEKVNSMNPQDYCYFEVNFAAHTLTNKRMIPVIMEEEMRQTNLWRGRVAAELGQHKYIDLVDVFTDFNAEDDSTNCRELLNAKCRQLSEEIHRIIRDHPLPSLSAGSAITTASSSTSTSTPLASPFRFKTVFLDPLSYEAIDLCNQLVELRRELPTNVLLNEELRKVDFYEFFVSLIGFSDLRPLSCFLSVLLAVDKTVLVPALEALISFFFLVKREDALDTDEEKNEEVNKRYDRYQRRILLYLTDSEGIKLLIQLFHKFFPRNRGYYSHQDQSGEYSKIPCQLVLVFRVLKNYDQRNYDFLQSMSIYDDIVINFQRVFSLTFHELAELFEVGHLKEAFSLKDLIDAGFSFRLLTKHFPLSDFLKLKIPLYHLQRLFHLKELRKHFSFNEFVTLFSRYKSPPFKLKDLAEAFTFEEFVQLKTKKFTLKELIESFDRNKLLNAFRSHRCASSVASAAESSFCLLYSFDDLRKEFSLESLVDLGYSPKDFKDHGVDAASVLTVFKAKNVLLTSVDLATAGYSLIELESLFKVHELKGCGYSVADYQQANFPLKDLVKIFSLKQLVDSGYAIRAVITAINYYPAERFDFSDAGIPVELFMKEEFLPSELRKVHKFSIKQLLSAGCSLRSMLTHEESLNSQFLSSLLKECKTGGINVSILKESELFNLSLLFTAGFSVVELLDGGFSLQEIYSDFSFRNSKPSLPFESLQLLKAQGESLSLLSHFCLLEDLKRVGYSLKELYAISSEAEYTLQDFKRVGFSLADFKTNLQDEVPAYRLRKAYQCSVCEVLDAGYALDSLVEDKTDGASIINLLKECKECGVSLVTMKESGLFELFHLVEVYSASELLEVGYSLQVIRSHVSSVSDHNYKHLLSDERLQLLKAQGESLSLLSHFCLLEDLKRVGYSLKELYAISSEAEYTLQDFKRVGFSLVDFKTNLQVEVPAYRLRDECGLSVHELLSEGFSLGSLISSADKTKETFLVALLKECRSCGCSLTMLKDCDLFDLPHFATCCSLVELVDMGFPLKIILSDYPRLITPQNLLPCEKIEVLQIGGLSLSDFHQAFSLNDLWKSGYTVQELQSVGYSVKELKDSGVQPSDFKKANISCREIRQCFSVNDLWKSGYTVQELLSVADVEELKDSGVQVSDFKNANISLNTFHWIYSLAELVEEGYLLKEIGEFDKFRGRSHIWGAEKNSIALKYWLAEFDPYTVYRNNVASLKEFVLEGVPLHKLSEQLIIERQKNSSSCRLGSIEDLRWLRGRGESLATCWPFFSLDSLLKVGYSLMELKNETSFDIRAFKLAGISDADLVEVGFTEEEISANLEDETQEKKGKNKRVVKKVNK